MRSIVELSLVEGTLKQLAKDCPDAVAKLQLWVEHVETHGLLQAEAIGWFGMHEIGTKGTLALKLTDTVTHKWRAEYLSSPDGSIVLFTEVHNHDY